MPGSEADGYMKASQNNVSSPYSDPHSSKRSLHLEEAFFSCAVPFPSVSVNPSQDTHNFCPDAMGFSLLPPISLSLFPKPLAFPSTIQYFSFIPASLPLFLLPLLKMVCKQKCTYKISNTSQMYRGVFLNAPNLLNLDALKSPDMRMHKMYTLVVNEGKTSIVSRLGSIKVC